MSDDLESHVKKEAYINRIETAVPSHEGHSSSINFLSRFVCSESDTKKFLGIAKRLGIEKRYTVLEDFFDSDGSQAKAFYKPHYFPSTQERMARYQKEALPLAKRALEPLLTTVDSQEITHLILTSCTGFYAPGLDVDIVQKFSLSPDVERTIIGYMGCYAAISGLKLARHIVASKKDAKVLMVNLELCTLHWRKDNVPLDQLISFLLFADGCAASIISREPVGLKLEHFYSTVLENSLHMMGWTIGNDGFFMNLDSQLAGEVVRGLRQNKNKILQDQSPEEFDFWAIHPGGRNILDGIRSEWKLSKEQTAASYDVMKNYGNMSSPTIMFILKRFLNHPALGQGCGLAFGPGLTLESFIFRNVFL